MKIPKLFKNNLTVAMLAVSIIGLSAALSAYAVGFFNVIGANPSGVVYGGPGKLNSIQIYNPSTVATTVYFYDSGTSNYTGTNIAYTNYTVGTFTGTSIYTNFFGRTNTNTFTYKSNVVQNVVAGTYTNRLINVIGIPASNTVLSTLSSPIMFGLMYTNSVIAGSNLVITADINPQK